MRTITLIIIHCSATRTDRNYSFEECRADHMENRGYADIGYHFYIRKSGEVCIGRPVERIGAHCIRHNRHSIGICYEGGLDAHGNPADTRTDLQKAALRGVISELKLRFPRAVTVGHRDLNPQKSCPCFDVVREYKNL